MRNAIARSTGAGARPLVERGCRLQRTWRLYPAGRLPPSLESCRIIGRQRVAGEGQLSAAARRCKHVAQARPGFISASPLDDTSQQDRSPSFRSPCPSMSSLSAAPTTMSGTTATPPPGRPLCSYFELHRTPSRRIPGGRTCAVQKCCTRTNREPFFKLRT